MMRNPFSLMAFCIALLLLLGCTASSPPSEGNASLCASNDNVCLPPAGNDSNAAALAVQKVEIIHFHGTHQCYSCITVGDYAEETVNRYFAQELATSRVTFSHVNVELPENRELAEKYGVTGASLWIGVYDYSGFHKEQNTNVWYKIDDKEAYMAYLKGIIEKRLAGDLS